MQVKIMREEEEKKAASGGGEGSEEMVRRQMQIQEDVSYVPCAFSPNYYLLLTVMTTHCLIFEEN